MVGDIEGSPLLKFTSATNRNAPEILFLSRNGLNVFLRWMDVEFLLEVDSWKFNMNQPWRELSHPKDVKMETGSWKCGWKWYQTGTKQTVYDFISCEDT